MPRYGLKAMTVGPLEVNCYILWDADTLDAFVIDAGGDALDIAGELAKNGLKAAYIVNTHGHFDHVGGDAELKALTGARIAIHPEDEGLMREAHEHGVIFGIKTHQQPAPDVPLKDGMELKAGSLTLTVIHTPGHTKGGVCLYDAANALLFTGDTLFAGGVGRTDFEGGSYDELMRSIKGKLLPLGGSVRVFPGHGPSTRIDKERVTNPFIAGANE